MKPTSLLYSCWNHPVSNNVNLTCLHNPLQLQNLVIFKCTSVIKINWLLFSYTVWGHCCYFIVHFNLAYPHFILFFTIFSGCRLYNVTGVHCAHCLGDLDCRISGRPVSSIPKAHIFLWPFLFCHHHPGGNDISHITRVNPGSTSRPSCSCVYSHIRYQYNDAIAKISSTGCVCSPRSSASLASNTSCGWIHRHVGKTGRCPMLLFIQCQTSCCPMTYP